MHDARVDPKPAEAEASPTPSEATEYTGEKASASKTSYMASVANAVVMKVLHDNVGVRSVSKQKAGKAKQVVDPYSNLGI